MNPKNTTFTEKMGFKDTQLTSPKHDEIIIWLMNPENLTKVLLSVNKNIFISEKSHCIWETPYFKEKLCEHTNKKHEYCILQYSDGLQHLELCPLAKEELENSQKPVELTEQVIIQLIHKIEAEYPITNTYNNFMIGFIDLKVTLLHSLHNDRFRREISGLGKKDSKESDHIYYYLEVKTEITSFGETLRQINTYRKFREGEYVLVTPKTPFKEAFERNGVKVYEID